MNPSPFDSTRLDAIDALDRAYAMLDYVIAHDPVARDRNRHGEEWVLDAISKDIAHVRNLLQPPEANGSPTND